MDDLVAIILVLFLFLVVPPVILVVIISQLKREIRNLSLQFFGLSAKIEKLIKEMRENQNAESVQSQTATSPVSFPPLSETVSPEMFVEESVSTFSPEENIISVAEEEFLTESIEAANQLNSMTEKNSLQELPVPIRQEMEEIEPDTEKEKYRYAAEESRLEESAFFDRNEQTTLPEEKTLKKEKDGIFSSQFWGENLLSKIGIITFVLGIAFFVKYAIDKDWINEIGRVGIGLLTGMAILGIGHKLRKQYDVFSSILAGGGFAVFYITITLAFREYELIPQSVAFALLVMVTIGCVVLSVFYDKKELALFSLLGGFAAPFLVSTGVGSYIVLFSYILILNTGMIWLSFRKSWHIIGTVSFFLSQAVIWSWLLSSFTNEYGGVILFLLLFFIQFHILVVADNMRKTGKFTGTQAVILLGNNISLFAGGIYIFSNYPTQMNGLIAIGLSLLNAVTLIAVFRNKRIDNSLKYLLIATILTFVTVAIPIQLDGYAITLLWSAEIVVVLVLWLRSGMNLFRFGLYGIILLAAISYLLDIQYGYEYISYISTSYQSTNARGTEMLEVPTTIFLNRYFITGITLFLSCLVSAWLLKKELNKEIPADESRINRKHLTNLFRFFYVSVYVVLFVVFYTELSNQLTQRITSLYKEEFHISTLATYFYLFAAITIFLNRKKLESYRINCGFLLGLLAAYASIYFYFVAETREIIFLNGMLPTSYFYIHLLSLIPAGYLIWQVWQYSKYKEMAWRTGYVWILTILSVIIVTFESDNLTIMAMGNRENYFRILYDVHTFGYPILWGILAMVLMIGGLKRKDIILRKISLVFFAFIIVKFYLYDVWQMSQGGRIVSFVILGLILLVVSFMQQRIRKLVKEEDEVKEDSL